MVENVLFDADATEYSEIYENALHFSRVYRDYAATEAQRLVDRLDLRHKDLVEIGSGDGRFLSLLAEIGDNRGRGFDPSYDADAPGEPLHPAVSVIAEYFDDRHAQLADLVISRHVLEHIPEPGTFMSTLRSTMDQNRESTVFFEVPNANFLLGDQSLWDVIYEHCSYFTSPALERVFADNGFDVREIRTTFHGQCLTIEAGIGSGATISSPIEQHRNVAEVIKDTEAFGVMAEKRLQECRHRLEAISADGKRVALWGAGARAVVYLNMTGLSDAFGWVVDLNPRKHGNYLPGSGLRIEHPDTLSSFAPDLVLTINPVYLDEIEASLRQMGINAPVELV